MSIQTELTRLTNAKAAIKAAIEGKGVTVPDATLLDGMATLIESIEAGGGSIALPDGFAMEMGIMIPESDIGGTSQSIKCKNTYKWNYAGRSANTYAAIFAVELTTERPATLWAVNAYHNNKVRHARNCIISSAGSISTNTATDYISFSTNSTSNLLRLNPPAGYPLKAGITYLWIVIGEVAN